jgi:glycosyltransferase involved in cell wall biosynthesis
MKKVIHLMSTHAFSGAENVACQIINSFKNNENYEMIYVSRIKENKKNLQDRNINYYKLAKFNYKNIKNTIKKLQPDIIHAHDARASIMAALFYKDATIISHIHANHENMRNFCFKTILFNIFSKRISKILWVSQSALDNYKYKKNVVSKSVVLYNVINSNEIYEKIELDQNEYENFDLIFLGRMTFQKNPLRLIKIIKKVKKAKENIKVALVGSGELDEQVKQSIKDNDLEENIQFFGFVNNPYKILNSSKMLIMTSRYEGTPMSALEAFALGKPIISTPTDGLVDIIENGKTGFILAKDEELINEIINLKNDDNKIKEMSKNVLMASKKINNIESYKNKLEKIYN